MLKKLKDFDFQGKRALVRVDFNVPMDEKGNILDDFRIRAVIPTIDYLIKNKAKVILISHLAQPLEEAKSKSEMKRKFSLRPIAEKLEELTGKEVKFLDDCLGEKIEEKVEKMKAQETVLLENLRFYKEEEENNEEFAKSLARLADIYINDAFAVSHRVHASIVGIPKYLPSGAGLLLEREARVLSRILKNPERPFLTIIGGKKVETKIKLIDKISEISDFVLIGGLIPKEIEEKNIKLKYPQKIVKPIDWVDGADVGEKTIELFVEKIKKAKTIFWNGPLGKIEEEKFSKATREIARAIIETNVFSVVGGGETVEFFNKIGLIDKFSFVSTGGGAMLDYLVDGELVGIEALESCNL